MKKGIFAAFASVLLSGTSFAHNFGWCPELTASVKFQCDDWGTLNILTVARVPNFNGSINREKYKISYNSFNDCLEAVKPFQKKFAIVTAPKQAQFALCDKWNTMHTLMIRENATLEKIQGPHAYLKKENCVAAQEQFNDSYPAE